MKNKLLILLFIMIALSGCSENENPVSSFDSDSPLVGSNQSMLVLPAHENFRLAKVSQASELIDGKKGGTISLYSTYSGGPFGTIEVRAYLKFKPRSFEGKELITILFDDNNNFVSFLPHKEFLRKAEFSMDIIGLDLSGVDESKVDFVYIAEDGSVEKVRYKWMDVDKKHGRVRVSKAQLDHFSRYGWVN